MISPYSELCTIRVTFSTMGNHDHVLYAKYPPSPPCSCRTCSYFCARPGWWLVHEARLAMENGHAKDMMIEFSPDASFGVLTPAFKGNGGYFALEAYAHNGCTFLDEGRCSIHRLPYQPMECRFCHHTRLGRGLQCHADIAKDWNTSKGRRLVMHWLGMMELEVPAGYLGM